MRVTQSTATPPVHAMPFTRIELLVLSVMDGALQVLLGKRSEPPYEGRWALPGGVLRIDLDADLDAACARVAQERLGVVLPSAVQLCAVGGRKRDPRAPWALSIVYRSTLQAAQLLATPGKRLDALRWAPAEAAAADKALAFDHAALVGRAVAALREEVATLRFPQGLMPESFTLAELQSTAAAVLGRPVDKSGFRRKVDAEGVVRAVEGEWRTGPFRPAQVYRLSGQ